MGGDEFVVAAFGVMSAVAAARDGKLDTGPEVVYRVIRSAFWLHMHEVCLEPTTRVVASPGQPDVYAGCGMVQDIVPIIVMTVFNEMLGNDVKKMSAAIPAGHVASLMAAALERVGPRPASAAPLPAAAAAAAAASPEEAASSSLATGAGTAAGEAGAAAAGAGAGGEMDTEAEWRARLTQLVAEVLTTKLPTYVDLNPRRLALPALLAASGAGKVWRCRLTLSSPR